MRQIQQANLTLATKLLAAGVSYGFAIGLARLMGPQAFGTVAFFMSLAAFGSVAGALGQQLAVVRFLPSLAGPAYAVARSALVSRAGRLAIAGAITVGIVFLAGTFSGRSGARLAGFDTASIWLGAILVPIVGWADFQSSVARGLGHVQLGIVPKEILWRAVAGTIVVAIWWQGASGGTDAAIVLAILAIVLVALNALQALVLAPMVRSPARCLNALPADPAWRNAILPFWVNSTSNVFLANADIFAVGVLLGPAEAGIYFAANRLVMLLSFHLHSHNVVLAPLLAGAWAAGDRFEASRLISRMAVQTSLVTVAFGTALFIAAPIALSLFGPDFVAAALPLRLLVLGAVVNTLFGPGDIVLNMCGGERAAMRAGLLTLVVGTLLIAGGGAVAGATGVAAGVVVATIVRKLAYHALCLSQFGLRTDALAIPAIADRVGRA